MVESTLFGKNYGIFVWTNGSKVLILEFFEVLDEELIGLLNEDNVGIAGFEASFELK